MLILKNTFNNSSKQTKTIILPDGSSFKMNLYYKSLTSAWYFDIIYNNLNFTLLNQKLTNNLNALNPFKNKLNFGLSFVVSDGGELWYPDDFENGRVKAYLLDKEDLIKFDELIANL